MKTGNGKIANLPAKIRDELNWRINDGEEGKELVEWLNAKPEVVDVVTRLFDGKPISQQNLSQWRTHGYRQWHVHHIIMQEMMGLASNSEDFEETGVDCEKLVGALTANYAEMIQRWIITPPEQMTYRREVFKDLTHEVLALRHSGFRKQQLAIQQKRLELSEKKANAGGGPGNRRPASRSRASTSPPPSVSQSQDPEPVEVVEVAGSPEPAESRELVEAAASRELVESVERAGSPEPAESPEPVEAAASREPVESIEAAESPESAPHSLNPDHDLSSLTVLSLPNGSNEFGEVPEATEAAECATLAEEMEELNRKAGVQGRVEEAVKVNGEAGLPRREETATEAPEGADVSAREEASAEVLKEADVVRQGEGAPLIESDNCPPLKDAAVAGLSESCSVSVELDKLPDATSDELPHPETAEFRDCPTITAPSPPEFLAVPQSQDAETAEAAISLEPVEMAISLEPAEMAVSLEPGEMAANFERVSQPAVPEPALSLPNGPALSLSNGLIEGIEVAESVSAETSPATTPESDDKASEPNEALKSNAPHASQPQSHRRRRRIRGHRRRRNDVTPVPVTVPVAQSATNLVTAPQHPESHAIASSPSPATPPPAPTQDKPFWPSRRPGGPPRNASSRNPFGLL